MCRVDKLVQKTWTSARDHVKRRLALLLSDCVYSPAEAMKISNKSAFTIDDEVDQDASSSMCYCASCHEFLELSTKRKTIAVMLVQS